MLIGAPAGPKERVKYTDEEINKLIEAHDAGMRSKANVTEDQLIRLALPDRITPLTVQNIKEWVNNRNKVIKRNNGHVPAMRIPKAPTLKTTSNPFSNFKSARNVDIKEAMNSN